MVSVQSLCRPETRSLQAGNRTVRNWSMVYCILEKAGLYKKVAKGSVGLHDAYKPYKIIIHPYWAIL